MSVRTDVRTVTLPSQRVLGYEPSGVPRPFFDDQHWVNEDNLEVGQFEGVPLLLEASTEDVVCMDNPVDILVSTNADGPWVKFASGTYVFDRGHPFIDNVYVLWTSTQAEYAAALAKVTDGNGHDLRRITFLVTPRRVI